MFRRLLMTFALLAATALAAAGCVDDDPDPIPEAESTSPSPTQTETASEPSWEDDYTPRQLQAYEAALQRWESYQQRSETVWAKGKATPAAEALFEEYFPSPVWQVYYQRLETYAENGVTIEGLPTVLWSRPTRVHTDSLEIKECVDYTTSTAYQDGKAVERESWGRKPMIRKISLSKPRGYDWLFYTVTEPTQKSHTSCKP